ncbi:uncharacterized protein LOC144783232 [Lissotriton helveticus]
MNMLHMLIEDAEKECVKLNAESETLITKLKEKYNESEFLVEMNKMEKKLEKIEEEIKTTKQRKFHRDEVDYKKGQILTFAKKFEALRGSMKTPKKSKIDVSKTKAQEDTEVEGITPLAQSDGESESDTSDIMEPQNAKDRILNEDTSVKSCCCCATQCFKWLLGLMSLVWIALSIAEIVIGSVYLQQCPAQRFIPIYLIVNGVIVIVMSLLSIVAGLRPNKLVYGILALLSLFWFAWLITGSVWTFPLYPNFTNCNRTVYLFTFSILIIQWIILALSLPAIIVKLFSSFLACSSCSSCCLCSQCSSCVSCVTK